jgi:hypothetical protein
MTQAVRIRQFVLDHYVAPAKAAGHTEITVRAGDVHRDMSLMNAMPAVCSAIGSRKFDEFAGVARTALVGPANGANVYFTFSLSGSAFLERTVARSREPALRPAQSQATRSFDFRDAVVLVSCVKSKLSHSAPARALYTSPWFRKVRGIVEASSARWFVLSSRYGLVAPDVEVAQYDYTLNSLKVAERKEWATNVIDKLLPQMSGEKRIVMFAGHRYREFLVEPLRQRGLKVEVPMEHLALGEQLAWLSAQS